MLKEWYDNGGLQKRPEGYDVQSWIFLPQHGNGYSVVNADSLETIWRHWLPWRELLEFTIEPCRFRSNSSSILLMKGLLLIPSN